ncbi:MULTISPECIES: response regulator transcription factor [Paenibacillus]|uniref:Two component transcriptional regulator, AraC family n=2 Tax=Paenibacillus lactis TaxID=228574 RepID=G4HCE8_9BACL|nr:MULTISPECIES: response regulator [Paenibacillus]EHB65724.1 two component transcriptional regulator, AraC family [Paenibacillus lactis 154]MBP1891108.1 two-component system response regulator YesN [Paenibacillus lactis]MCM3493562.1 response regulator [Paenibacillus lactis]HAG00469.1 DNA-binding response regulator [Paenibacillus lactis]
MYKVLLVDDEELDLEGMRRFIPWSDLNMVVRGSVNNALSACDIIEKEDIDILVSDVNMPYMSGLELARIALERKPSIRIIFVSGYQEFSYVQQALSLKAYSYVLKPMNDSELVSSLLKAKRDLDEEIKQREVETAYQEMIPIVKSDILIRLLEREDSDDSEALAKQMVSYGLDRMHWPVRVAVIELDNLPWEQAGGMSSQRETTRKFLQHVQDSVLALGIVTWCKLSSQRIALLLEEAESDAMVRDLVDRIRRQLPATVTAGIGGTAKGPDDLQASHRQAVEAVEGKMFLGKGTVIKYEDVRAEPAMLDARMLDERMKSLLAAMEDYELVRICDELDKWFDSVKRLRSRFTVHNMSSYIIWKLDQYLSSKDEDLFELLGMEMQHLDILMQFETVNDIRGWLVRRMFEISEKLYEKANSKDSKFIRSVISFIKEHMSENITIRDIAQHFSFSPSHIGYLIKEKSGHTFNELLVQLRMEKACELLKQPGMKIYEVADQVGYRYLPYFSRQFKEKFGITPLEYRKRESE